MPRPTSPSLAECGPGRSPQAVHRLRADPAVAAIIAAWRSLVTPPSARRRGRGRPTLVACSGGADSCALAIALAAAGGPVVLAHILHDLRPRDEAEADRDSVRALALRLGVPFATAEVTVMSRAGRARPASEGSASTESNTEARARRLRYRALAGLADQHGCPFIATAHHAGDQIETMLMALLRGAGVRGLAGIPSSRPLATGHTIIRPMLGDPARAPARVSIDRSQCRRICSLINWTWREDATNADTHLLRNALRAEVLPELERLRPGAARRAARTAALLRDTDGVIADRVEWLMSQSRPATSAWPRTLLRAERAVVIGALVRRMVDAPGSPRRKDRLTQRILGPIVRAVRDESTDPRTFTTGGFSVRITAHEVRIAVSSGP